MHIDPGNFQTDLQAGAEYKYERNNWKNLFSYMGPSILVSVCIAYIDPGNFQTNLQTGGQYKYWHQHQHPWIIVLASLAALIIQSLAANLGVVTDFSDYMVHRLPHNGHKCLLPCRHVGEYSSSKQSKHCRHRIL